jgi:hypothetical protein
VVVDKHASVIVWRVECHCDNVTGIASFGFWGTAVNNFWVKSL